MSTCPHCARYRRCPGHIAAMALQIRELERELEDYRSGRRFTVSHPAGSYGAIGTKTPPHGHPSTFAESVNLIGHRLLEIE